jgi:polyphosphate kinase 2
MTKKNKVGRRAYEDELLRLQQGLVDLQEWVRETGQRVVVIFEGRDAAGKGGTITRITEYLNPRHVRVVALPSPSDRERTQWYFQRYVEQLPAAGEIVLFDRSWYNRAVVEPVMGYCTVQQHRLFLRQCPTFERMLMDDGILLRKYWFSVSDEEQERRFASRVSDPLRRWKFSENDLKIREKWEEVSRAKDEMFVHTDLDESPWFVVEADVKRHARLNMIAHLLSTIPYRAPHRPIVELPPRPHGHDYQRPPRELFRAVPDHAAALAK